MKSLKTLIKLHRKELDEKRRELTALENKKEQLQQAIISLIKELKNEQKIIASNPEIAYSYTNYAIRNRERQQLLAFEIVQIDEQIDQLSEVIFELFSEVKKYEIALENKQKQIKAEEERQETIFLDEISINGFIRKDKN
jgi:flagellar export protein FliJ